MGNAAVRTQTLAIVAGCTVLTGAVGLLTARTGRLTFTEGVAIAFGGSMALAAVPLLRMAWRGQLDLVAIMARAGSTGAGGRRWARAWPAIMVGFALGGAAIGLQEMAQWRQAHSHAPSPWQLTGSITLWSCIAAFLISFVVAVLGRPRWAVAPHAAAERRFSVSPHYTAHDRLTIHCAKLHAMAPDLGPRPPGDAGAMRACAHTLSLAADAMHADAEAARRWGFTAPLSSDSPPR